MTKLPPGSADRALDPRRTDRIVNFVVESEFSLSEPMIKDELDACYSSGLGRRTFPVTLS